MVGNAPVVQYNLSRGTMCHGTIDAEITMLAAHEEEMGLTEARADAFNQLTALISQEETSRMIEGVVAPALEPT